MMPLICVSGVCCTSLVCDICQYWLANLFSQNCLSTPQTSLHTTPTLHSCCPFFLSINLYIMQCSHTITYRCRALASTPFWPWSAPTCSSATFWWASRWNRLCSCQTRVCYQLTSLSPKCSLLQAPLPTALSRSLLPGQMGTGILSQCNDVGDVAGTPCIWCWLISTALVC